MIRISTALIHPSGTEIISYDTNPFKRHELRRHLNHAINRLCDKKGHTIEDGRCSIVIRIEFVEENKL